jgi:hypothetical protein
MMAMKSDRNGRCDSVFVHIERLILVPHWHIDFLQENTQKVMCRDGTKTKETKESNKTSTCQVKQSVEKKTNNHDRRCKSVRVCVELLFWRHIHTLTFLFRQSQWEQKLPLSHTQTTPSCFCFPCLVSHSRLPFVISFICLIMFLIPHAHIDFLHVLKCQFDISKNNAACSGPLPSIHGSSDSSCDDHCRIPRDMGFHA